jgi:hypothetical protein
MKNWKMLDLFLNLDQYYIDLNTHAMNLQFA